MFKKASGEPSDEEMELQGEIPRHKGDGRPKIWLPDGSKRKFFSRPSSLGDVLEDKENLAKWRERAVLDGIRRDPAIMDDYEAIVSVFDEDYELSDVKLKAQALTDRAKKAAGASIKAEFGTILHEIVEAYAMGEDPGFVPDELEPCFDAFRKASTLAAQRHGYCVLGTELDIVNDEWQCAGSMDQLVAWEDDILVGDGKSSQSMVYSKGKFTLQTAAYARGVAYDPLAALKRVDEHGLGVGRSPLIEGREISRERALIIHFPSFGRECHFILIDIGPAQRGFELQKDVKEWRNFWNRKAQEFTPVLSVEV